MCLVVSSRSSRRLSRRTVAFSSCGSWEIWYIEDTDVEDEGEAERSLFASCLRARAFDAINDCDASSLVISTRISGFNPFSNDAMSA
ncbi:unnamed protein product [Ectocarpus sp. CCAP 1310/34]|nr:unnamed protein product [Ectocarpus sp. CCAP 1310/34]